MVVRKNIHKLREKVLSVFFFFDLIKILFVIIILPISKSDPINEVFYYTNINMTKNNSVDIRKGKSEREISINTNKRYGKMIREIKSKLNRKIKINNRNKNKKEIFNSLFDIEEIGDGENSRFKMNLELLNI